MYYGGGYLSKQIGLLLATETYNLWPFIFLSFFGVLLVCGVWHFFISFFFWITIT